VKVIVFDDVLVRRQGEYATPGLELTFYQHADDAVQVVTRERPDVVLMDYAMPDHASGLDAIVALRGALGRGTRIVAISSDERHNQRMLDAGADDALPKTHVRGYLSRLAKARGSSG
jgi:CheY-like chemotaxis protein